MVDMRTVQGKKLKVVIGKNFSDQVNAGRKRKIASHASRLQLRRILTKESSFEKTL